MTNLDMELMLARLDKLRGPKDEGRSDLEGEVAHSLASKLAEAEGADVPEDPEK